MNVLQQIIREKKPEIPKKLSKNQIYGTQKNVIETLKKSSRLNLIAELKRKSPSKGNLNPEKTVQAAISMYEPYASALSILTEKNYFGGSLADLEEASRLTRLPLLRKDFLTDPIQVAEARLYGADFYLLIAAALQKNQLAELIEVGKEYNMPALVEVHNQGELEMTLDLNVELLGINNRNLADLTIDLGTTKHLTKLIPPAQRKNLVLVSESGIRTAEDLLQLQDEVDCVLMGTVFMESPAPEVILKNLFGS